MTYHLQKLIAASDSRDTTVGFSGIERLNQGITPTGVFLDPETALARSNTRAPASAPRMLNMSQLVFGLSLPVPLGGDANEPGLARSKTTLNVPSNARELTSGGDGGGGRSPGGVSGGPARSNTVLNTARASPNAGMGGPVRGLSVRRGGSPPATNKPLAAAPPPPGKGMLSTLVSSQI